MQLSHRVTGSLFAEAFISLPNPTLLMDSNFTILEANEAFFSVFHLPAEEARGQDFVKLMHTGEIEEEQIREFLTTGINGNRDTHFEAYIQTADESGIWAMIDVRCFRQGDANLCVTIINDISARKKEEEELRLGDTQMMNFFDSANDLIQSISPDGSIIYANKKWLETLGYAVGELPTLNIAEIIREDRIPQFFTIINQVKQGAKFELVECVFMAKDGREIFVEGNVDGYFESGKFVSVRGIFRDITRRKVVEEIYSLLVRNIPMPIYIIQNGIFRFVNPSFQSTTGYSENELIGKESLSLVHPEEMVSIQKNTARLLKLNKAFNHEYRLIRKNGEIRWVMETLISIPYENGRAILGTLVDFTERKLVEEALVEAKDRYQTLFDSASDAIFIHNPEGRFLEVNDAVCKMLGYTRNELLKLNLKDIDLEKQAGQNPGLLTELFAQGHLKMESEHKTKDGRLVPVEIHARSVEYEDKMAVMSVVRDITERKQIENIRKRHQARLESLVKIAQFKAGNVRDLLHYSLEEVIKLTDSQIGFLYFYSEHRHEFSLNIWSKEIMKVCSPKDKHNAYPLEKTGILGEPIRQRKPITINSGQTPALLNNGYPEGRYQLNNYLSIPVFRNQQIVALVSVANKDANYDQFDIEQLTLIMDSVWNILERWRAEEALRESEQRFRHLIELSQDGILGMDEKGRMILANSAACRMLGYTQDELLGKSFAETFPAAERVQTAERQQQILANQALRFERQAVRKDGSEFPLEISASPLPQGHFMEIIRDITLRKKMEKDIRESEQKYRLLVENQTDLVAEINPQGQFLFVNPAYCKLLGKNEKELLKESVQSLIHPDDYAGAVQIMQNIQKPPFHYYSESRMMTHKGWRWIEWNNNAVMDDRGRINAITCIGRDITESKEAKEELQRANQQLRELDKLKDNFLSTVSHELRTPLTSIKSFAEILMNYEEDKATQKEFLGIINEESDRLTRLINDFLDVSKIQAGRMQWKTVALSLADAINSAVNTAWPLMEKEKLVLNMHIEPDLPMIMSDPDRMIQVVTNILGNAVKFTPEGGRIEIRARSVRDSTGQPEKVIVSVRDSGIGIAPENHQKIFENFGQVGDVLKDRPKGTGLGLPICKKIIENFGGSIWVESALRQGTTFFFSLPAVKAKPAAAPAPPV
jgi:PAS domain S-box-containing protein